MNWEQILQDVVSSSISGVVVAAICGFAGWTLYTTGIKGKEKSQLASERKKTIFVPLKYEMKCITAMSDDIWQDIRVETAANIVDKEDEYVVDDDLYQKCEILLDLITAYRAINPNRVVSKILCKRFEEKYIELYGSATHPVLHYDEASQQEVELEEYYPEIYNFSDVANSRLNIKEIFRRREMEEYYQESGFVGPAEEYLVEMFGHVLPKKDKYSGIKFDNIIDSALVEKRITPAEYIAKGFDFFAAFDSDVDIKKKMSLLDEIKQTAFEIYEMSTAIIRSIGKKYEKE